jgi:hypothetical protein
MSKSKQQKRTEIKDFRKNYFEEKAKKAKKMCLSCFYHFLFFTLLTIVINNDSFLNILSETVINLSFWILTILSIISAILTYRWYDGWLFQLKMKNITNHVFEELEKELGKYDKN